MTELIEVSNLTAKDVFAKGKTEELVARIEKEARSLVPDLTTAKGRQAIKSLAYKVAQSKTALDGMGKDIVADWKEKAKRVDGNRKLIRTRLDNLRDEVRKPLTDWEEEQAAKKAAEELAAKIEADHGEAIALNELHDANKRVAELEAKQAAEAAAKSAEAAKASARDEPAIDEQPNQNMTEEFADQQPEITGVDLAQGPDETATAEFDPVAEALAMAEKMGGEVEVIKPVPTATIMNEEPIQGGHAEQTQLSGPDIDEREHQANVNRIALNALVDQGIDAATAKQVIILIAKNLIPDVYMNY